MLLFLSEAILLPDVLAHAPDDRAPGAPAALLLSPMNQGSCARLALAAHTRALQFKFSVFPVGEKDEKNVMLY